MQYLAICLICTIVIVFFYSLVVVPRLTNFAQILVSRHNSTGNFDVTASSKSDYTYEKNEDRLKYGTTAAFSGDFYWAKIETKIYSQSREIQRLSTDNTVSNLLRQLDLLEPKFTVDPRELALQDLVFVSAWSSNHHNEAKYFNVLSFISALLRHVWNRSMMQAFRNLCPSLKNYRGFQNITLRLIVYNLGDLGNAKEIEYRKKCGIAEFRMFNVSKYPQFVSQLSTYRFKPLIIAEALIEFPLVLWLDTSMTFRNDEKLVHFEEILNRIAKDDWRMKFAFFNSPGHSIFAATHPGMYRYLNVSENEAKNHTMWEASNMLWLATSGSKQRLLRPWIECALIQDCMAPPGYRLPCHWVQDDAWLRYANCHRFDQSAMSIIALMQSNYNESLFHMPNGPLVTFRSGRK